MPRLTNPRDHTSIEERVTLPGVLRAVAYVVGLMGTAAGLFLLVRQGALLFGSQLIVLGLAGGLLWYVMVRVVERLDRMTEALEQMAER